MVYEAAHVFKKFAGAQAVLGATADLKKNDKVHVRGIVCGFGCKASRERVAKAVKEFAPEVVVLAGFAGACRHDIKNGTALIDKLSKHEKINHALKEFEFVPVRIASVDKLADEDHKARLHAEGYEAVEMEGEFFRSDIAKISKDIDFAHIRWVSDAADSKLPMPFLESMMDFETGDMRMSKRKLVKTFIFQPRVFKELMKFAKEIAPAQAAYNKGIEKFISAL